jgi:hypothetical protein
VGVHAALAADRLVVRPLGGHLELAIGLHATTEEAGMFNRIFPDRFDNHYRGHRFALWVFALIAFWKAGTGTGSMFNGRTVAQSADGIPLDTFSSGAVETVLAFFAIWGLSQLLFGLQSVLVISRYRSMIPFMYVLLLIEHVARRTVFLVRPVPRIGTPPGTPLNLAILALILIGLVLSLRGEAYSPSHGSKSV